MKRINLFEFTDLPWFPQLFRKYITNLIVVMHRLLKTDKKLAGLLSKLLAGSNNSRILDLCSGSGGPMSDTMQILQKDYGIKNIKLTLTDIFPDRETADKLNNETGSEITYQTSPVDATEVNGDKSGVTTMIGSFHHFKPTEARQILESVQNSKNPICIFEVSDNSNPVWLWWISVPINFIMTLFITPMIRGITWHQLLFTYLIPIIPLCFAWDGAVSNARTYTLDDLDELLSKLPSEDYRWEKGKIEGKTKQIYLIGYPV
jgi:hypothetical protein